MLNKKRLLTTILVSSILLFAPIVSVRPALAQGKAEVCLGLGGCASSDSQLQGVVEAALNILSIVVGIAAVTMIILAGFRYITAGGDASKIASAQNTIIWAVVGIAVASLSQVIVQFVLSRI